MNHYILYFLTVFIWGTTWIAIKFQLGEAPSEISIFYRFAIATFLITLYCKIKGQSLRFNLREHFFLFLLGACMFSLHYIFVYNATSYLVSGLVSVIFSLVSLFNIANAYFFFQKKPEKQVLIGASLGLLGIIAIFWKALFELSFQSKTLLGIGLALIGTLIFSLGNIVSKRNQSKGMSLVPSTAIAMAYGSFIMLAYTLALQLPFVLPHSPIYWASLVYLAVPGSIIAFLCYLSLIARIGPERAGYASVFFPIIALALSFLLENYQLMPSDLLGVCFVILGNCLVMYKKKQPANISE